MTKLSAGDRITVSVVGRFPEPVKVQGLIMAIAYGEDPVLAFQPDDSPSEVWGVFKIADAHAFMAKAPEERARALDIELAGLRRSVEIELEKKAA